MPSLNIEVYLPHKYLSNFWRSLDLPLMNCEVELDVFWTKIVYWYDKLAGINFVITSTQLYVLVMALSINDSIKFLKQLK